MDQLRQKLVQIKQFVQALNHGDLCFHIRPVSVHQMMLDPDGVRAGIADAADIDTKVIPIEKNRFDHEKWLKCLVFFIHPRAP
jgi:hypothetical protein